MKKVYLYLLLLIVFVTGCTKNNSREDVVKYVKENLNLSNVSVSETYIEVKDDEGYTDKLWTVVDNTNNIIFHVLDDFYYGMESTTNHLINDYSASVFMLLYDRIPINNNIVYEYKTNDSFNEINLTCNYTNKNELNECYNSLISYKDYIESQNFNLTIPYSLEYNYLLKKIGDYNDNLGVKVGTLNNLDKSVYDEAMYEYLSTALIYQIDSGLNEITKEDMDNILKNKKTHLISIKRSNGSKEQYNDIIAHTYSYGISFGTLYKILEKEGFNPVDSKTHYTVRNKNGDVFEISYNFNDYMFDNNTRGYYYIKNGEKIKMDAYFYNCFREKQIKEMFDIELEEVLNN